MYSSNDIIIDNEYYCILTDKDHNSKEFGGNLIYLFIVKRISICNMIESIIHSNTNNSNIH